VLSGRELHLTILIGRRRSVSREGRRTRSAAAVTPRIDEVRENACRRVELGERQILRRRMGECDVTRPKADGRNAGLVEQSRIGPGAQPLYAPGQSLL